MPNENELPVFKIDLNLEPRLRFKEPVEHFKSQITELLDKYQPLFPSAVVTAFKYLDWTIKWYHAERYQEIQGIAEVLGAEDHIVLMVNYVYEFTSYCTSIIAKQEDGTIVHMRMLDFSFPDDTRNLTYVA